MIAAVFEAVLNEAQAAQLAGLMEEGRPTRPAGVLTASLLYDGATAQLIAFWRDREMLDAYLAATPVPRGRELMLKVGADPTMRIVDVLDFG